MRPRRSNCESARVASAIPFKCNRCCLRTETRFKMARASEITAALAIRCMWWTKNDLVLRQARTTVTIYHSQLILLHY